MPIEMVNKIEQAIKAGKLSKRMKQLVARLRKERPGITLRQIAEAIVSMIENKRKSRKALGGDMFSAYGLWTQINDRGEEQITSDGPFWLNIMGPKTALRTDFGPKFPDDIAMIDLVDRLKPELKNLKGHRNHRMNDPKYTYELNASDIKYEFDKGVSVYINPADKEIYHALKTGKAKPSPEVLFSDEDLEEDYITHLGEFKGLGIMIEKDSVDPTLGPHEPDMRIALGGESMTEEETKFEEALKGAREQFENDPKAFLEKREEFETSFKEISENIPDTVLKEFKVMLFDASEKVKASQSDDSDDQHGEGTPEGEGQETEAEKRLKELQDKLSKTVKELKDTKMAEKQKSEKLDELQKTLIDIEIEKSPYPKDLIYREGMSLDDVKAKIEELNALKKFLEEGNPEKQVPPMAGVKKEGGSKEIKPDQPVTDEQWKEFKNRAKELNLF